MCRSGSAGSERTRDQAWGPSSSSCRSRSEYSRSEDSRSAEAISGSTQHPWQQPLEAKLLGG
eukprot:scaffold118539_cov71-Phaeocystis_antarctica.AAC.3